MQELFQLDVFSKKKEDTAQWFEKCFLTLEKEYPDEFLSVIDFHFRE
jgi:hypothetical protein